MARIRNQPDPVFLSQADQFSADAFDCHWAVFPAHARQFLLQTPSNINLISLVHFWGAEERIECTRGKMAGNICVTSWYLAMLYHRTGQFMTAKVLLLNGAFFQQCFSTTIEGIVEITGNDFSKDFTEKDLPYFADGFNSLDTRKTMEWYLRKKLPTEYQRMLAAMSNKAASSPAVVENISAGWNDKSPKCQKKQLQGSENDDRITIIIEDDQDKERECIEIGVSTSLKSLFNEYADRRSSSLRSLRFSHNGRTLFLSSIGHKTPKELGMVNEDVISVGRISSPSPSTPAINNNTGGTNESTANKNNNKSKIKPNSSRKCKGKGKKKGNKTKNATKSLEEHKVHHSSLLSQLFEEAESKFKEIRQRLNELSLERSQPKAKKRTKSKSKQEPQLVFHPSTVGQGGKAGKSHFFVNVGDASNLYKTSKPSLMRQGSSNVSSTTIDLHGCTQDEAVEKLNEALVGWYNEAMRGSYPWVKPVTIVCGCGNQVLSETVERWIKGTDKVANAPMSR